MSYEQHENPKDRLISGSLPLMYFCLLAIAIYGFTPVGESIAHIVPKQSNQTLYWLLGLMTALATRLWGFPSKKGALAATAAAVVGSLIAAVSMALTGQLSFPIALVLMIIIAFPAGAFIYEYVETRPESPDQSTSN